MHGRITMWKRAEGDHFLLALVLDLLASPSAAPFMMVSGPPLSARPAISCSMRAVVAPVCLRRVLWAWTAAFFFGAMTRGPRFGPVFVFVLEEAGARVAFLAFAGLNPCAMSAVRDVQDVVREGQLWFTKSGQKFGQKIHTTSGLGTVVTPLSTLSHLANVRRATRWARARTKRSTSLR